MMYVTVDKTNWAIVHKHHELDLLRGLAWIECVNHTAIVPLGNPRLFTEFAAPDLKRIYQNATGVELKGYGIGLAQAVHMLALRMPETQAVLAEVLAQRKCVMDGDKSCYQYAFGAQTPISHLGEYTPDPIKLEAAPNELSVGNSGAGSYVPPAAPAAGGAPHTAAQRPPSEPRAGGSRETIFRVADEMWAAAGSPKDIPTVLGLRKQIMTVLEAEHGVKKTTSSTALGDWQKKRLG